MPLYFINASSTGPTGRQRVTFSIAISARTLDLVALHEALNITKVRYWRNVEDGFWPIAVIVHSIIHMEHEKMLGEVSSVIIRYKPMELKLGAEATSADLAHLEMTYHRDSGAKELKAYFSVGRQDKHLRVLFPNVDIFRVIDDMHRPMEEHGSEQVGHVSNYFAYTVQGSPFWEAQRETSKYCSQDRLIICLLQGATVSM